MFISKQELKDSIVRRLKRNFSKNLEQASRREIYDAAASTVMEIIQSDWIKTSKAHEKKGIRQMYYFSAEFLMGRALINNMNNMKLTATMEEILKELSEPLPVIEEEEPDAGLGNGGLGRLAACFLDSLATLDYPGHGYGIRYKYGMFEQHIENGKQVEYPDRWLLARDPWEVRKDDLKVKVYFGGTPVSRTSESGKLYYDLQGAEEIIATPYDMPIVGYGTNTVNRLRLWEASSDNGFDLSLFNGMEYNRAFQKQIDAESISCILYPNDSGALGKALRLKQQYFFTSASLQDIIRSFIHREGTDFAKLKDSIVIQLNDTHPVVAIPELMRILMDDYHSEWEEAWETVSKVFAYTNHTILSEALEKWDIEVFQKLLPRIYQIVEEINRRFLTMLKEKYQGDWERHNRMAILANGKVYMARLAIAACFSVNGVAALHTEILKTKELREFYELFPEKFNNKTNGVTQRRWLLTANPLLAEFITKHIGSGWIKNLSELKNLERFVNDKKTLDEFIEIKRKNKIRLAEYLEKTQNVFINPDSIYDIQIKRLHEYKRQLLNILHIISVYNRILNEPSYNPLPRTFIFGAKAAAGYKRAKDIIKLINTVADRINNDRRVTGKLRVVFVENYRVSVAEKLFPAADISEQISTAGKEASGTGNMKFMINGAITLGTLDGANIEIAEEAGIENEFIFGLKASEIHKMDTENSYNPKKYLEENPELEKAVNSLIDGTYTLPGEQTFREIYDSLINGVEGQRPDVYYVLADFTEYQKIHEKVIAEYYDKYAWAKKALLNIARSSKFSSDRTIEEYAKEIWKLKKLTVD
ncbi:glycogen/starch/alpha-glucan phosphorylase [Treponema pedis]|uniref:glycogen/starch/alpha-glucan phosphorylase n=1 Tax=Treponema pedis TaxID=409322 RepID=UPI000418000E|nr:glycogen/starch/alpha-glucan phosphorylase [Treponema pedis]